jgi:hypothetical protein
MRIGRTITAMTACILSLAAFYQGPTSWLPAQQPSLVPIQRPAEMVTRSFLVKHLAVDSAATQVRQVLMPSEGRVFFDRGRNLVVVKGTAAAQQMAYQLLQTIDRPAVAATGGPETRRYMVDEAKLGQQAALLSRRFPPSTGVQIRPDMARGQLLIVAPSEIHRQITGLLMPLAQPTASGNWTSRIQQRPLPLPQIKPANSQNRTPVAAAGTAQSRPGDWRMRINAPQGNTLSSATASDGAGGFADQVSAQKLATELPAESVIDDVGQPLPTPLAPALQPVADADVAGPRATAQGAFPVSQPVSQPVSRPAARVVRIPNRAVSTNASSTDPSASTADAVEAATTASPGAEQQTSGDNLTFEDRFAQTVSDGLEVPKNQMFRAFGSVHESVAAPVQDFFQGVHDEIADTLTGWAGGLPSTEEEDQDKPQAARLRSSAATPVLPTVEPAATVATLRRPAAAVVTVDPTTRPAAAVATVSTPPAVAARVIRTAPTQPAVPAAPINQSVSASGTQSARPMANQIKWRGAFPSTGHADLTQQPVIDHAAAVEVPVVTQQVVRNETPPARPAAPAIPQGVKLTPTLDEVPLRTIPVQQPVANLPSPAVPQAVVQAPPRPVVSDTGPAKPTPRPAAVVPPPTVDATRQTGSVLVDRDDQQRPQPSLPPARDSGFKPLATPSPVPAITRPAPVVASSNPLDASPASMIKLVADSDAEIGRYVARFLKMNEVDSELAGCDVRMAINNRQIWLVLKRNTGTVVKLHIGEIRIDENGSSLFLYKPSSL